MATPRLAKLELQIMEVLWGRDAASIREIVDALPGKKRPAYTTIQTTLYRMEDKGAVRRVGRIGNFDVFTASVTRQNAQRRLIDELLDLLGGSAQPIMSHLIDAGKLSEEDIREAERALQLSSRKRGRG
jgi:predicted transcriptional regulator